MKILFGIVLAAGIAALGLGLGPLSDASRPVGLAVAAAGAAVILAIILWVPSFMERREAAQKDIDTARAGRVADRLVQTGESHHIGRRGSGLLMTLLLTAIPVVLFQKAFVAPSTALLVSAACGAVVAFFAWAAVIPGLSAPPLSFTRDGVKTALYGSIPWDQVEGLALSTSNTRFGPVNTLELSVPNLEALRPQMHSLAGIHRLFAFGRARTLLRFSLSRADAVFASELATLLWQQRTGRRNVWVAGNPRLTAELREEYELLDRLNHPDVLADPRKALELMERHREQRKKSRA